MALPNIWSFAATVTILVMVPGLVLSQLASIDNIIAESANSSKDFAFNYDVGFGDVRVELDMLFSGEQWDSIQAAGGISKRKAIKPGPEGELWTDGLIPYDIEPYTFSEFQKQEIRASMDEWQRYSCLTFRPATNADENKIVFKNGGGCFSRVGMFGGAQDVGLAPGCRKRRIIIHELGHVLGLHHEQTRPDRDGYVRIIDVNIAPRMLFNFDRHSWNAIQDYEVPYDYFSIMHYGKTAFSMNNRITMQTTDPRYQNVIGTQPGLSFLDIKIINLMYPCESSCNKTATDCPSVGFLGKDCQCWCQGAPYKVCDGTETDDPGPGGVTGGHKVVQSCGDSNVNCAMWAGAGHCANPVYTTYMSASCRRSCRLCGVSGVVHSCGDSDVNCPTWAGAGHCVNPSYTAYMSANCRRSCRLCGGSGVVQPCGDSDVNCPTWAGAGHCVNPLFTTYMSANCRQSCQLCGGGGTIPSPSVCQNVDTSGNCDVWAQTGLCQRVPDFMLAQCRRSCNACTAAPASSSSSFAPPPPQAPPPPPCFSSSPPLQPMPSSLQPMPPMPSSLQPMPSSLQPMPSSLQPMPSSLQPMPSSWQPLPSSLQPLPMPSSLQPLPSSLQPLPYSLQPLPYSLQPLPYSWQPLPSSLQPMPSALQPLPSSLQPMPSSWQPMPSSWQPLPSSLQQLPPSSSSTCMDLSANCPFWAQAQNLCAMNPYFMNVCCPFTCGVTMCAAPTSSLSTYCNTQYGYGYGRKRKK